ncbi:hypothetical protein MPTK1_3g17280 [Marchantia polymorpha subsp. ruderalis]|uniref:Uncharacterized protein n=2 Tax=Marchantia polymorpha TaxID=3197 RepID=A0AAF6B1R7_MARPO|nr:hypothetical protein MARPO_0039s0066 [Marchantia polymorpha]BBN05951.1 hypothetical protein Mp_3g17280 [Marchantia polymorpha subsp. ruderalis]|eukprot:PTQ40573.1 hypothetical protein MARPO_0039s0066 [Marchantia polymorpha]
MDGWVLAGAMLCHGLRDGWIRSAPPLEYKSKRLRGQPTLCLPRHAGQMRKSSAVAPHHVWSGKGFRSPVYSISPWAAAGDLIRWSSFATRGRRG